MRGINKREIPIGMLVLLILLVAFMFRFMKVAASKDMRENLSYIQLLNAGMPVAKGSYYDEDAYLESNITLKSLALETLNIKPLDPIELVMNEIPYFAVINDRVSIDDKVEFVSAGDVDSFNLNNESVDEVPEEETNKEVPAKVSKDNGVYDPSLKKELDQSKPEVLIYHTHNSEGYSEERTSNNEAHNVVGVGSLVTKELQENYGISVIHDKTIHSASYEQSYNKSRETVQKYTKEYEFEMVIDIHRDSVGEHNKKNVTANINNESVAKLMFVTTKNNRYFNEAEQLAYRFIDKAKELFPEILRRQETYKYNRGQNAFNQDFNENSMLIEVGAEVNTSAEARTTAKYIARLIAEEINGKDE